MQPAHYTHCDIHLVVQRRHRRARPPRRAPPRRRPHAPIRTTGQAPKSILNPRSAAAPLSRVLIGCTNGLLLQLPWPPSRVYCTILWVHVAARRRRAPRGGRRPRRGGPRRRRRPRASGAIFRAQMLCLRCSGPLLLLPWPLTLAPICALRRATN
jgi:hypothetical protein